VLESIGPAQGLRLDGQRDWLLIAPDRATATPLLPTQMVIGQIHSQPKQPGSKTTRRIKLIKPLVRTEKRFLRAFPGHGFGPWIDTLLLARAAWPELPDHSLGALCENHGLKERIATLIPGKSWHDALFDAVASLLVAQRIIARSGLQDFAVAQINNLDAAACHAHRAIKSLARDAGLDG
jgi:DNA polymerase III epsilon subunit-like protein